MTADVFGVIFKRKPPPVTIPTAAISVGDFSNGAATPPPFYTA
jgi:hypothetical protein